MSAQIREPDTRALVYVRWLDASHDHAQVPVAETELAELEEVGFVYDESDEKLTLSCESQAGSQEARLWLSIPKAVVKERIDFTFQDLLTWLRRRARRKG